jgi:hypothetical protein
MPATVSDSVAIPSPADGMAAPTVAPVPYPPGAVSRFLAWADRLPGHGWWLYPALAVVLFLWAHGVLWASGTLPFGTVEETLAVGVPYGPMSLGALAYINRVAERSIAAFWPATGWPVSDRATWTYRFVTTPGGFGWLSLVIGIPLAAGAYLGAPTSAFGFVAANPTVVLIAYLPTMLFGYTMLPVGIFHIGRQLRLVARIHREARAIDPFDRVPVYAFSRLTAQAGLLFLIVGYYSFTLNGAFQAGNAVSIAVIGASVVVGLACFVLPLWGIHDRLVREKELLLKDVDSRVTRLGSEMYGRIDAGQFDSTKVVSDALAGMVTLRERIIRLPTWPWPPQVFRGFLSALLLPVVVYLVSRIVAAQIGA